jgi:hypothetical protein
MTFFILKRSTGFLDFVHLSELKVLEKTLFQKLDLFPLSGEGRDQKR